MSSDTWLGLGAGMALGCFVGWLITPWVYPRWRRRMDRRDREGGT